MTRAEKLQLLKRAYERQGFEQDIQETDVEFITRIVDARIAQLRIEYLQQELRTQYRIENPVEEIDASDL